MRNRGDVLVLIERGGLELIGEGEVAEASIALPEGAVLRWPVGAA